MLSRIPLLLALPLVAYASGDGSTVEPGSLVFWLYLLAMLLLILLGGLVAGPLSFVLIDPS
jgi:hypothetical protein